MQYKITDQHSKNTWTLKYIIMWCAIQILLCQWSMANTHQDVHHHTIYIYVGIMDFYMSIWFFVLHAMGFEDGKSTGMDFEVFHYYYMSCYGLFRKRQTGNSTPYNNLSLAILEAYDFLERLDEWRFPGENKINPDQDLAKFKNNWQKYIDAWKRDGQREL